MMSVKKVTITVTVTPPENIGGLMIKMLSSMVIREDVSTDDFDFLSDVASKITREYLLKKELDERDKGRET